MKDKLAKCTILEWLDSKKDILTEESSPFADGFDTLRYQVALINRSIPIRGVRLEGDDGFILEAGELIIKIESDRPNREMSDEDQNFRTVLGLKPKILSPKN